MYPFAFSSPEATILLVCARNRDLWPLPILSMRGVLVLCFFSRTLMSFCFQPIRFVIFDKESMNRRLPVWEAAKGLYPWHSPEGSRPFEMGNAPFATSKVRQRVLLQTNTVPILSYSHHQIGCSDGSWFKTKTGNLGFFKTAPAVKLLSWQLH